MKILYHHRTASRDGQAVHIEEMVSALEALGHEVRVVSPAAGGERKMGDKVRWVHKLKDALPKALYELLELSYSLVAYWRLRREMRSFEPDFIYERYNLFLLAGTLVKRRLGIPLLLEVNSPLVHERSLHGGLSLKALARWAEGTAWRSADYVLPVTRVLGRYVADYGVPEERIVVIPNGINAAHFAASPMPEAAKAALGLEGRLVLGFTGFVRDWHGVDRVVRWLATSAAPADAVLLIVGDGPARGALESLAEALGISGRVRFTGVLDRQRVPACVAAFDVALQPAVTAYASPLKLMEYLVLGKAIVAPAEPNLLEILENGENALTFDAQDERGFEATLARLCADASLRRKLSRGARDTIVKRDLTWLGNAKKVAGLMSGRAGAP
jgi:glycosyltransferase involved in cell wall biosynthesis